VYIIKMKVNPKEIEALISSSGEKRYTYFVKRIVDWEEVWGLYNDGWALASTDDGQTIFPVWPAKEYAALCIKGMWSAFKPKVIPLDDFLVELIPNLRTDRVALGVFSTPEKTAVVPDLDQIKEDIVSEISKYEN
jgi:uncharacterized protein DUF2750